MPYTGNGEAIGDARASFDTRGKDGAKYLCYDYISATISASKDTDGMGIRKQNGDGALSTVCFRVKMARAWR